MSTVNGFQVGSETLKYNYESLDNYNTPNFSTSSSETYAVGDYVMYNGKLYKCTTATTGGTWVSGNWTEAVLSDDVSGLTRQVNDKQNKPVSEGTAGQVLGLDSSLQPAWIDQTGGGSSVVVTGEGVGSTVQGLKGNEGEGTNNTATGDYAHVEGGVVITDPQTGEKTYYPNTASGLASHAEGSGTTASRDSSHAEGSGTIASGNSSHAEGRNTTASGAHSHAEGYGGKFTINNVEYESGAKGTADHTEGHQTMTANGQPGNHAEGFQTRATGGAAHAEGHQTFASGQHSHAEGIQTTASGQQSHAEGNVTTASGNYSHAEGYGGTYTINGTKYESGAKGQATHAEGFQTRATGGAAHAEGNQTTASGPQSHAEGIQTTASGQQSHAEGNVTTASGSQSHAEGWNTIASGNSSHAEGRNTTASGDNSHAEGTYTIANRVSQHVFGEFNVADPSDAGASDRGTYVEIVGNGTSDGARSNARTLDWNGNEVLTGKLTVGAAPTADMDVATKKYVDDNAGGGAAVVVAGEGTGSTVQGLMGTEDPANSNTATGRYAHVEGGNEDTNASTGVTTYSKNTASGDGSHAEGAGTTASGDNSHAEGFVTTASGARSHAEGDGTVAGGDQSHAEGQSTTASGYASHSEGDGTVAGGDQSHAEGWNTTASGARSHAEGTHTAASGWQSHVEGDNTVANHKSQHVFGEYNVEDPSTAAASARGTYVEIVGNGASSSAKSNARTLDWDGNEVLAGGLTVGAAGITIGRTTITEAQLTALLAILNS